MNLSIEIIALSGCAFGTMLSVTALILSSVEKNREKSCVLANCPTNSPSTQAILRNADKDIEDLKYQIEQLASTLGDKVEPGQIQETKSLLNQVLQNLHRIPRRALE